MDVSIFVETTFDDGETKRRNLGRLRRTPDEFGSENVGLLLDDAKTLLRRLQGAIVQDQVGEAIEARRKCDGCGKHRAMASPSCSADMIKLLRRYEYPNQYAAPERLPFPSRDHRLLCLGLPPLRNEHV